MVAEHVVAEGQVERVSAFLSGGPENVGRYAGTTRSRSRYAGAWTCCGARGAQKKVYQQQLPATRWSRKLAESLRKPAEASAALAEARGRFAEAGGRFCFIRA